MRGFFTLATAVLLTASAIRTAAAADALPKLVDLGAKACIPCKMMAPILDELTTEYAGRFDVEFIDVWQKENAAKAKEYGIKSIPTQIFFAADGKELWRHEGFIAKADILAKWKELGYDFAAAAAPAKIERWTAAKADARAKDAVCDFCDGDVDAKTRVVVKTDKGDMTLCSPHCYFIMYSCLTEDKTDFERRVSVADFATGDMVAATEAVYLTGLDEATGRRWIRAFASRDAAVATRQVSGGSIIAWPALQRVELCHRCGFCDRACYPQDAAEVLIDGVQSWGCCAHCAMGIAARTGKDIEVRQPDGLTGGLVVVKTLDGKVASIDPPTAVAWYGKKKNAEGKWVSAGCFHQGFFQTPENLRTWVYKHPLETGEMITIEQSLADKMALSPQQISKACKIGECAPK
ncbi:MAG: thioredoxin family protein [Lentisphaeria bacterium]|nr:thioredoxin family protein [Lentisphaeria bacterium]